MMLKLLCSVMLFLLVFNRFEAYAKSPPPGTGYIDVPTNVFILLDTSGSMALNANAGTAKYPVDVAYDNSGNRYVATREHKINKYKSNGTFIQSYGSYGTSTGKFKYINSIEFLNINGREYLHISDEQNARIQVLDINAGIFKNPMRLKQSDGTKAAYGLTKDSNNNTYVSNGNGDVEVFNSSGVYQTTWDTSDVIYLASYIDPSTSIEYVLASRRTKKDILIFNTSGSLIRSINLNFNPSGLNFDNSGNLYIGEYAKSHKLYKYSFAGALISEFGDKGAVLGKFNSIKNIAKDNNGNIWVADYYNDRIQKYDGSEAFPEAASSRMDQAKKVIKDLVSNSSLTAGANFGLIQWNSYASLFVPLSKTGAAEIYNKVDNLSPGGGTYLKNALSLAKTKLESAGYLDESVSCMKNLLIVISDGEWFDEPNNAAIELAGRGVKTFVVGFTVSSDSSGGEKYISLSQDAGTYPTSPIFAENAQTLYESIADYILQNLSSTLTFSAPTIMPEVSGEDYIVQATFKYKTNHQWKGHLNKYDLNSGGDIGSIQWDAGQKLAAKRAVDRKIWTVGQDLPFSDYNNFITDKINALEAPLLENNSSAYLGGLEDDIENLKNIINFIRGVDVYGEYTGAEDEEGDAIIPGERWKLADIYHSRAVVVGAPDAFSSQDAAHNTEAFYRYSNGYDEFKASASVSRNSMVYVGSNGGMLHAFDAKTGEEQWAFIPPGLLPNLKEVVSTVSNQSVSIFGVDGSPVAKDIFVNGEWKTILMVGAGQGGKTYSILDITDPVKPSHIFSFSHNSIVEQVSLWNASGTRTDYPTDSTIQKEYDFSKLGEAWSNPLILRIPVGSSGAMKWTAVFGGGFNAGINAEYGAQLYVIDLEDGGKIIKNMDIADDDSGNGVENSVPARLMAVTPDSSAHFQGSDDPSGAVLYVSDLEGKLWKINLTNQGTLYDSSKLFDAETTESNARLSFNEITATLDDDGNLWQYYGTGDVLSLGDVDVSIANRGYGYRHTTPMTDFSQASMHTVDSPFIANVARGECPQPPTGWFIDLDPHEKITAKSSIANGYVYFSRYTSNSGDICSAGSAKVSEHDYLCGTVETEFDLGSGVPTETLVYNNKIYLGISTDQASGSLPSGWTKVGNLLTATVTNPSFGSVQIESWWEER